MTSPTNSAPRSSTTSALLLTWLVWGSTFLAIHIAVSAMPPLLLMGSRFVVAGIAALAIALLVLRRRGASATFNRGVLRDASLIGLGLVTVGMGATGWAVTRLDTGIAALLVASAPLWIALLGAVAHRRVPVPLVLLGLAIGIAGVATLVVPMGDGGSAHIDPLGALVIVLANAAWAGASLFAPKARTSGAVVVDCGLQMLLGGLALCVVAVGAGELGDLTAASFGREILASWTYLVVVGSLGGFLAYAWLLDTVSASLASTHAFVNPLVAVCLGAFVLHEQLGMRTLIAGIAVVAAVVALLEAERREPRTVPEIPTMPARTAARARRVATITPPRRGRTAAGWSPAPTPAFAARRGERPWVATDGMDALAIDAAFEGRR